MISRKLCSRCIKVGTMYLNIVVSSLVVTYCNITDTNIHLLKHNEKKGSMYVVTCFLCYEYYWNITPCLWFCCGINTFPRVKLFFSYTFWIHPLGKLYQWSGNETRDEYKFDM